MQLRVAIDQPWDVAADVLVVPVIADPAFDGPLGELDRRAGGELQSLTEQAYLAKLKQADIEYARVLTLLLEATRKLDPLRRDAPVDALMARSFPSWG